MINTKDKKTPQMRNGQSIDKDLNTSPMVAGEHGQQPSINMSKINE